MKKQIESLQNCHQNIMDAWTEYQAYMKHRKTNDVEGVLDLLRDAAGRVSRLCDRVTTERDERNKELYGIGVCRIKLFGGPHVREVTIQRPDNVSDNPYIMESSYNAIKFSFGEYPIHSEKHDINVVARGRIVATIKAMP